MSATGPTIEINGLRFPASPTPVPSPREATMLMKFTTEEKWHQLWEAAKNEVAKFPKGKEREDLMRKARQSEAASQINRWISSPGLMPPR
jgi:hypothetical protein